MTIWAKSRSESQEGPRSFFYLFALIYLVGYVCLKPLKLWRHTILQNINPFLKEFTPASYKLRS